MNASFANSIVTAPATVQPSPSFRYLRCHSDKALAKPALDRLLSIAIRFGRERSRPTPIGVAERAKVLTHLKHMLKVANMRGPVHR